MSLRVVVTLTYPEKSADIKVSSETTVGALKEAAAKALKLEIKDYSLSLCTLGEDAKLLSKGGDDTKVAIKPDSTLVVITPPNMLPEIGRAVQQECRDRSRMPSSA
eukprot:TRINITY_DN15212_c0_g2_i2.p1 TRINITY_DN15212_c0_g2~~TRINITY_DN15212_c0_g2_i2.p1  ORF type:complete len:106 (+),score=19.90 TRINITY_DN15212_c0_g2_i2:102-419(+)